MIEKKHTRILVCIPNMGGIHPNLVAHLLKWAKEYDRTVLSFYFTYKVAPVDRARNQAVDYFFNAKGKGDLGFTHLLFIDADTIPPLHALRSLLAADKDIVSGLTPMLQFDKETEKWATMHNCFIRDKNEKGEPITRTPEVDGRLHEIDRCGSSCILIKREVFEKMQKPYYKFVLTDDGLEHKTSEDIGFCDKAKELGFKIYADTSIVCQHHKSIML